MEEEMSELELMLKTARRLANEAPHHEMAKAYQYMAMLFEECLVPPSKREDSDSKPT